MTQEYMFSIVNDTANGAVDSARLVSEIQASAILTALDSVKTEGDVLSVTFKEELSGGDSTVLSDLVSVHDGTPLPHVPEPITLAGPVTLDGRPIFMPLAYEDGTFLWVTGKADHVANGRGEGDAFVLTRSTAGSATLEWSFSDWVKASGGTGCSKNAGPGDCFSIEVFAPATTVEAVTPGTGTCVLADVTGVLVENGDQLRVVVPYPGGTHNVVTAVPVPASVGEPSYWAWSNPPFGKGVVTAKESGGYNLYAQPIPLARPACNLQLLGDRSISIDTGNVKPMQLLPHWKFKATLTTAADRDVSVVWEMKTVRMRSTRIW